MQKLFFYGIMGFMFWGCSNAPNEANKIVDESITKSGGDLYENSEISFEFRDRAYIGKREGGKFEYKRIFQDSVGELIDTYTNDGFTRTLNGKSVEVHDTMAIKYESSINSVFYFALLPYKLNDPSVKKELLGQVEIKDQTYHKIKVSFQEEGGGKDHEDNFIYWINTDNYFINYLAYDYETDEGGMRFREAFNSRMVNGIRIADYVNYKPKEKGSVPLESIDIAFENDELVELSRIVNENVRVNTL